MKKEIILFYQTLYAALGIHKQENAAQNFSLIREVVSLSEVSKRKMDKSTHDLLSFLYSQFHMSIHLSEVYYIGDGRI